MSVQQLTIFIENKTGNLNQILSVLANNNINVIALTVADSSDFGLLRAIVSNPVKAVKVLRKALFTVRVHEILALEMHSEPGSMSKLLDMFAEEDICIEYVYAFSFGSKSILLFRTDCMDKALEAIETHDLKTINDEDLKYEEGLNY